MASEPIQQAQNLKLCDFCENETIIKWRCMQCNMCMCHKCKKIHLRMPNAAGHDIIDVNIPLDDVQTIVTTDKIACKEHQQKINCLFCRTCDTLVCPTCICSTHMQHEFAPIDIVLQEKKDNFRQKETKILKKLIYCKMKMKENEKCESKCESLLDETVTKIKQKEQELKDVITKFSENLQSQVEDERKAKKKVFTHIKNQIDQTERELITEQNQIQAVLMSKQGKYIFEAASDTSMSSNYSSEIPHASNSSLEILPTSNSASEISMDSNSYSELFVDSNSVSEISTTSNSASGSSMESNSASGISLDSDLSFDPIPINIKQFVNGDKSLLDLSECFGIIEDTNIQEVQLDIGFEVVKTYTVNQSSHSLITVDDQSAWISSIRENVIRHINIQDGEVKTTKEISTCVYDMTITPNNDILLSSISDIKLLTKTGEIKPFLSLDPLSPWGIHVTSDNVIMVGVTNHGDLYQPTDKDTTRAIYVYGQEKQRLKCLEYDSNNKRLFTLPRRINTNINNDIVVIDRTSSDTGRMVVVDREGDLKWTYNGHPTINNSEKFYPWNTVTTALGHIIVCDFSTHSLHVLSKQGHILSCHVMEDMGITYPSSLDIDRKGQLWVDCCDEIHIVKLLY